MEQFKAIVCFLLLHPTLTVDFVAGVETTLNPLLVCLDQKNTEGHTICSNVILSVRAKTNMTY